MYELTINATFSAAHAIVINGWREPLHGHDWRVTVAVGGPKLDHDGLLIDFHWLEKQLREVIGPFQNQNLNECSPFKEGLNPTAEHVAMHIGRSLSARLETRTLEWSKEEQSRAVTVRLLSVRVTEAVGCAATFRP